MTELSAESNRRQLPCCGVFAGLASPQLRRELTFRRARRR